MSSLDSIAALISGGEATDAQTDALLRALRNSQDVAQTIRSDLSGVRSLGDDGTNALQRLFFGTPSSTGYASGVTPEFDLGATGAALSEFNPAGRRQGRLARSAEQRVNRLGRLLDQDTSGFTNRQSRRHALQVERAENRLGRNLDTLGISGELDFVPGVSGASSLGEGPSLDVFFDSPEYALFQAEDGAVVDRTLNRLAAAGLADSGAGRRAVLDTVDQNLGNRFSQFVNRNLALSDRGRAATGTDATVQTNVLGYTNRLNDSLGQVEAAGDVAFASSAADLGNRIADAIAQAFTGGRGATGDAFLA